MRAVVQRVSRASVRVEGSVVGEIGAGLCALVCAMDGDSEADVRFISHRIASLRIFPDADYKMNLSAKDIRGAVLLVPQFTLAAETGSGARPSFSGALEPVAGRALFDRTAEQLEAEGLSVACGVFGAKMELELVNDGPVTICLDSQRKV